MTASLMMKAETYITFLKKERIIDNNADLSVFLNLYGNKNKSLDYITLFRDIFDELFALWQEHCPWVGENMIFSVKEFNSIVSAKLGRASLAREIEILRVYLASQELIRFHHDHLQCMVELEEIKKKVYAYIDYGTVLVEFFLAKGGSIAQRNNTDIYVDVSIADIKKELEEQKREENTITLHFIEKTLLFLHRLGIIKVEGGLFVFQTSYHIEKSRRIGDLFKKEDYEIMKDHYTEKVRQVHILGEYIRHISEKNLFMAEAYIHDYFGLERSKFIERYFPRKKGIIERPVTPEKYDAIFRELSPEQEDIIRVQDKNLIVIAWPGSGKTKTIVHKVASLILLDGVKPSQFLMLSFSRSAKYEIKKRLHDLLGDEVYRLQIETFHSFGYHYLGLEANMRDTDTIIGKATKEILSDTKQLPYTIIMIDEYQDINKEQFELIQAIMKRSEAKIVAVGDDDQNIYEFRGSDNGYIRNFEEYFDAERCELTKNFRSTQAIVDFTNGFIEAGKGRLKSRSLVSGRRENESLLSLNKPSIITLFESDTGNIEHEIKKILEVYKDEKDIGILAFTNDTVLQIKTILDRLGEESEVIGLEQKYKVSHFFEFFVFWSDVEKLQKWELNKDELLSIFDGYAEKYADSENIRKIRGLLEIFFSTHSRIFFQELKEYFYDADPDEYIEGKRIKISTVHKAKGREFGSVAILFGDRIQYVDEEKRRLLYVGLTRAKNNLLLFGNRRDRFFDELAQSHEDIVKSMTIEKWGDASLQMVFWLKDTNLGWNKGKSIDPCVEVGDTVIINKGWIYYGENRVIQTLSRAWSEKLEERLKTHTLKEVKIFQRLVYPIESWENTLVYLVEVEFGKRQ